MKKLKLYNHTVAVHCKHCGEWTLDVKEGICMFCSLKKVLGEITSISPSFIDTNYAPSALASKAVICPDCKKMVIPRFISSPPDGWEESCPECGYIWDED